MYLMTFSKKITYYLFSLRRLNMFQKKKSRVGQRHAWDKSISPKLCWDNELDEIITFYFFIILIPFLIDGRPICKKIKWI